MKDKMYLFAVTFDEKCKPLDSQLTRSFPASAAANPAAFFPDGYSPKADLKQFLLDHDWQFSVEGNVTTVAQPGTEAADGMISVQDQVRTLRFGSRRVNEVRTLISDAMMDELRQKATEQAYHLLDMKDKVREMLPDAKGLVQVIPRNIEDVVRPPQGWTKRKERMFQDWLDAGKPGLIAHGGLTTDPDTVRGMERTMFSDMMEQLELEDVIKSVIHNSEGGELKNP